MNLLYWTLGFTFLGLFAYAWHILAGIRRDNEANHRVSEQELWYALWPSIAALPEERRIAIRNQINVMRFNNTLLTGEGKTHETGHENSSRN